MRKNAAHYAMLAPFMLIFTLFLLIPVLAAVVLSFTSFDMVQAPKLVGLNNYIRLFFNDDVFLTSLQNTLVLALITGPVGFLLSFIAAWLINEMNATVRKLITLFLYAPSLAGNIYFIWLFIFFQRLKRTGQFRFNLSGAFAGSRSAGLPTPNITLPSS